MPAYDPNNPFAKILRGEFPCHKVYEDDPCSRLSRHHAALARPYAGDPEDAGPQHPRYIRRTITPCRARRPQNRGRGDAGIQADGINRAAIQRTRRRTGVCFTCTCM